MGEAKRKALVRQRETIALDTFGGRIHAEWDPAATVTPLGQLPFFIEFLKVSGLFEVWVTDCPLAYQSNNASDKRAVLASFLLSILAGHHRYAHITAIRNDGTHVGAVISHAGRLLGTLATPANAAGYLKLLAWTRSFGNLQQAGVEGTGTYGAGLARLLREQGLAVLELNNHQLKLVVRCLVPLYDGIEYNQLQKGELWDKYYMAAPPRQRRCVERYKIVKRA